MQHSVAIMYYIKECSVKGNKEHLISKNEFCVLLVELKVHNFFCFRNMRSHLTLNSRPFTLLGITTDLGVV